MKIYHPKNSCLHYFQRHNKRDLLHYFRNQGVYKPAMVKMEKEQLRAIFNSYVERVFVGRNKAKSSASADNFPQSEPPQYLPQ